jgi:serine/threonine-protein kinase
MGIVYLGRDPRINREVAIKTLRFEEIDESIIDEVKRRFFLEAESAGKLTHPGIIKVYDVGDDHDLAYMAMELIDGGDLASYCTKESRMPFGQVLKIVSMVADALDYAHAAGVVHRDIKPANIMLLKNKEVRVADFGIARVVESSKTQTGVVMGTPSYMSPEQISGKKVDGRSDLFSLGVVFFELLAGEKPFKGDNITTLMYNITTGTRSKVREAEPRIPQCVAQVIDRMIETDLEKRSRRGRDIVDDINRCIKILTQKTRTAPQSKPA